MDKIKNMENTTPFADAIETVPVKTINYTQIDILRDANRELKLNVLDLKEKLKEKEEIIKDKEEIINSINNIINKNGEKL